MYTINKQDKQTLKSSLFCLLLIATATSASASLGRHERDDSDHAPRAKVAKPSGSVDALLARSTVCKDFWVEEDRQSQQSLEHIGNAAKSAMEKKEDAKETIP